ncbi:MAG: hypothetical protein ACYSUD_21975, partial [Planctomycetota bacterium]
MLRVVFLSLRAASTDLPPLVCGLASVIGCRSWAKPDGAPASTAKAGKVFKNALRFIWYSFLLGRIDNKSALDGNCKCMKAL